jgi:hypothetical protein
VALKMALLPKTLVWAKTAHGAAGVEQEEEEFEEDEVVAIEVATESSGG